ncbi:MAG: transglutaminase-like domain-containing protein, partial [Candidatus Omnitrophica bacterium]|nr:transglutaminase-like domain-containing protein [Candidatus Omnitrophota bacterium]
QLINKKDFVVSCPVESSEPVIAANFSVVLPKQRLLHIKILNEKYNNSGANLKPVIKEEAGRISYTWQFKDIPQIIPESNMPPAVEINPTILLSTFSNWQDLYHWWWQLAKDKIKPDPAIKTEVRELTKGKYSDEAKIRAIYNFCAKEVRYVAVEYGQAGYEPHYAGDIFKNKYGDCKDQAILLVTMLKEAGFESSPVLIATKEYYNLNEDFPAMLFNHCIAVVYLKDKFVFLDPTAQTCSFGDLPADDQARKVFICKLDGYEIQDTALYPAEHNLAKEELWLEISGDEQVIARKSNFTYGLYDQAQRYWLLYTQPELIQEKLKETIQGISIGAKLIKYNIENLDDLNRSVVLRYEFYGPEYFTLAGNLRIMPQLAGLSTALAAKDKRKYPIDFGVLDTKEQILEIAITDNFIIKYIPQGIAADSPWLKITVDYSHKNNKIYFRQATQTKKAKVPEEEYPDFKKFIEGVAKKIKQRIVIERIK